ncbi:MAG: ribosome-associated translation inhibitor RaiA [Pseudomonadota bacterium]
METNYTFRNIEPTEALKERANTRILKLKKYLIKPGNVHVIFSVDGHDHLVEITLNSNGIQYIGHERTPDMYVSLNGALNKIEKQVKKSKERLKDHKTHA